MERLKAIERDIKSQMEEYALAEERMEVRYISLIVHCALHRFVVGTDTVMIMCRRASYAPAT